MEEMQEDCMDDCMDAGGRTTQETKSNNPCHARQGFNIRRAGEYSTEWGSIRRYFRTLSGTYERKAGRTSFLLPQT